MSPRVWFSPGVKLAQILAIRDTTFCSCFQCLSSGKGDLPDRRFFPCMTFRAKFVRCKIVEGGPVYAGASERPFSSSSC